MHCTYFLATKAHNIASVHALVIVVVVEEFLDHCHLTVRLIFLFQLLCATGKSCELCPLRWIFLVLPEPFIPGILPPLAHLAIPFPELCLVCTQVRVLLSFDSSSFGLCLSSSPSVLPVASSLSCLLFLISPLAFSFSFAASSSNLNLFNYSDKLVHALFQLLFADPS